MNHRHYELQTRRTQVRVEGPWRSGVLRRWEVCTVSRWVESKEVRMFELVRVPYIFHEVHDYLNKNVAQDVYSYS